MTYFCSLFILHCKRSMKDLQVDYSDDPRAVRIAAALWWYYVSKLYELLGILVWVDLPISAIKNNFCHLSNKNNFRQPLHHLEKTRKAALLPPRLPPRHDVSLDLNMRRSLPPRLLCSGSPFGGLGPNMWRAAPVSWWDSQPQQLGLVSPWHVLVLRVPSSTAVSMWSCTLTTLSQLLGNVSGSAISSIDTTKNYFQSWYMEGEKN